MAISLDTLFKDITDEFGAGVGSDRLSTSFVRACNRALAYLAHRANETPVGPVTSTEGTVALDSDYEHVLHAGIQYYLIRMGHRPTDPKMATVAYQDGLLAWEDAIGIYIANVSNEDQNAGETHIAKFGYISDTGN